MLGAMKNEVKVKLRSVVGQHTNRAVPDDALPCSLVVALVVEEAVVLGP